MIKIDLATIAAHPLLSRLASPPTYAKIVEYAVRTHPDVLISATYRYGILEAGEFVPDPHADSVRSLVDISDVDALADKLPADAEWLVWMRQKAAAAINLRGAGVAPDPATPHVPIETPGALRDDFKLRDLDAYFAFFEDRLKGSVVADPA